MLRAGNLIAAQAIKLETGEHRAIIFGEREAPAIGQVALTKRSILGQDMIRKRLKLAVSQEIFLDLNLSICRKHHSKDAEDGDHEQSSIDYTRLITSEVQ